MGLEEEEVFLFSLVFLAMMLRKMNERKIKTKKETLGQTALERVRAQKSQ